MADQKLRLTRKQIEIRTALGRIEPYAELTLWIHPDDRRILFSGNLVKADDAKGTLLLHLKSAPPELDSSLHVYVKFPGTSGVGKCRLLSRNATGMLLEVAEELVMEERRSFPRIHFRTDDEKTATLKAGSSEFSLPVLNASRSGLKFAATATELIPLRSAPIELTSLGGLGMKKECSPVWNNENSFAIRLREPLGQAEFNEFARTSRSGRVEPEKFFSDQEYFQTVKSNMEDLIEKLEKRPKLATAMKTLKIDRQGNYLRTHVDLLCYVSCSIGRMLGWVTQKTIDKLILAAYLHDIRYFEHPHLARIKSLAEFEARKSELTPEEQLIFLEGPEYSALMAKDADPASVDVERILIQQKERSDGSGFPAKVDFKQLYPLSCLFMVCHEFVDYVYSTPDWKFRDFSAQARSTFKGPYFIKILEAFDDLN
jgi:hypothetical protein